MIFVPVRELRINPKKVWQNLEKGEIILTVNGKPKAIIWGVNEKTLDLTLATLKRSMALMAVQSIQKESVEKGLDKLTDEEIETEIKEVRRNLRR